MPNAKENKIKLEAKRFEAALRLLDLFDSTAVMMRREHIPASIGDLRVFKGLYERSTFGPYAEYFQVTEKGYEYFKAVIGLALLDDPNRFSKEVVSYFSH